MDHLPAPLYRIAPSTRAKRLALRLDPVERVFRLVVPPRCPLPHALDFADQYEEWMQERLDALPPLIPLRHGQVIPLCGTLTSINITLDKTLKNTSIKLINNTLLVKTNKDNPSVRIMRWLKALARTRLMELSQEKADQIGQTIQALSVRDTKSRWGSCSADGALSYSWRLIFAPPEAMDYVVAHEVAHLRHLDHSKAFWALCRELSDDFFEGKYWMQAHGHELLRYVAATDLEMSEAASVAQSSI